MRGRAKILQEQRNLTWHVERFRCCFFRKDEDIDMEVPDDDEEMESMSSKPHEKPHQPGTEEPIFYPTSTITL